MVVCQLHDGDSYRHGTLETGIGLLTLASASPKRVRGAGVPAAATEVLAQDWRQLTDGACQAGDQDSPRFVAHVVVVVLNFSSGVSEWTLWSDAKYAEEQFHEMNRLAGLGRAGDGDRDLGLLAVWMPGRIVGGVSVSQGLRFACRTAGSVVLHVTPGERACSPVRT